MKPIIDFNKLTTVLLKGEQSYCDGRHAFGHELLLRVLGEHGIQLDEAAASAENGRRNKIRNARRTAKSPEYGWRFRYVFTVVGSWETYFEAIRQGGRSYLRLPHGAVSDSICGTPLDHTNPEGATRWVYKAHHRGTAAGVVRYIRATHSDAEVTLSIDGGNPIPVATH